MGQRVVCFSALDALDATPECTWMSFLFEEFSLALILAKNVQMLPAPLTSHLQSAFSLVWRLDFRSLA